MYDHGFAGKMALIIVSSLTRCIADEVRTLMTATAPSCSAFMKDSGKLLRAMNPPRGK
jgi:hypothetical protein